MPFMFRACEQCFLDMSIQARFLPRVAGFESREAMLRSGVDLSRLRVQRTWENNLWGSWEVAYYLRDEVQQLFDCLKDGVHCPEMDHLATTRRLQAEASKQ